MLDTKKIKTEWDLSPFYKNDKDPKIEKDKKEVEKKVNAFVKKWEKRTDWLKDPKVCKKALDEYEVFLQTWNHGGRLAYYFAMRSSLDLEDKKLKAISGKIEDEVQEIFTRVEFFTNRLSKLPAATQKKFLNHKSLYAYRHFLERLFASGKFTLSEGEEKVLSIMSSTYYSNWTDMVSEFIYGSEKTILAESGKKIKTNFSQVLSNVSSKKKKVRDSAAEAVNEVFKANLAVAEHEFNNVLQVKKLEDNLRGYKRPDESTLLADDMDIKSVDSLRSAVTANYNLAKRYYKLKARLFGFSKLAYHERNVPYGSIESNYTFTKACSLVKETLGELDLELAEIFVDFATGGYIDAFPKKGKRGGAFCAHVDLRSPTYILQNFDKTLNEVLTLAHEVGHGINNELMRKEQNAFYFSTPTSTAEVASTFVEDFVLQKILKTADDELRLALYMEKLNADISTIFRQIAFYEFEFDVHTKYREGGFLSKDTIGKIFTKHMKSYMGPAVSQDKGSENWWVYVPHFRYYFYVYSYAGGLLISKSLQRKVKENPDFIHEVKKFLAAGSSDSPKNLFKNMGLDISKPNFWDEGLTEIEDYLTETEKLAKKLGKI